MKLEEKLTEIADRLLELDAPLPVAMESMTDYPIIDKALKILMELSL